MQSWYITYKSFNIKHIFNSHILYICMNDINIKANLERNLSLVVTSSSSPVMALLSHRNCKFSCSNHMLRKINKINQLKIGIKQNRKIKIQIKIEKKYPTHQYIQEIQKEKPVEKGLLWLLIYQTNSIIIHLTFLVIFFLINIC